MTSISLITKGKLCRTDVVRDNRIIKVKLQLELKKNIKLTLKKGFL